MYSIQDIKAIGLSLDKTRTPAKTAAMPLALRSSAQQHPLRENEMRRVQGKRVPMEMPKRAQNVNSGII